MERPVFSTEFYRELASENPFGLTVTRQEVEAWFNFIAWPAYKTYHYTLHHKAVRRWWSRCSMKDLERAREAVENVKLEDAQTQQDALPHPCYDDPTPHGAKIRKIMGGKRGV